MRFKNLVGVLAAVLIFLPSLGCFHVGVVNPSIPPSDSQSYWMHGFLWGLLGSEMDSSQVCGNRQVARVDTFMSVGNAVLFYVTGGLYTPWTAVITCGQ